MYADGGFRNRIGFVGTALPSSTAWALLRKNKIYMKKVE